MIHSDGTSPVRLPLYEGSRPLFGRERQMEAIRRRLAATAFETRQDDCAISADSANRRSLLVTGPPGVGKTSLVEAAMKTEVGVLFCKGKYDQDKVNPMRGFATSFSHLSRALAAGNVVLKLADLSLSEFNALFVALSIPKEVVSATFKVSDNHSSKTTPNARDADYRWGMESLKRAVASFLGAVVEAVPETIVLCLDDLQWADTASIELFLHLSNVVDPTRVCLIGACRTNHEHVSRKLLASENVQEIDLQDISLVDLTELLAYLTKLHKEQLRCLAETIHSRTHGNPFHTLQFLQMLEEEDYLYFSIKSYRWEYNLTRIQTDTNITDHVIDIVRSRLWRLPNDVLHILFVSSFVGSHVDVEIVRAIIEIDPEVMKENLKIAATAGLINLETSIKRFKFAHDRIQQEVHEMRKSDCLEREHIHFAVGKFLVRKVTRCPESSEDWMLPVAVTNLNRAPRFTVTGEEKLDLADANCDAAKAMISKAAFFAASDYLRCGLRLLDHSENKWSEHYDRALEMTTLLAQMHLCEGAYDECHARADEVIEAAKCLEDKLLIFCVKAHALSAEGGAQQGLETEFQMLDTLGEKYCRKPSTTRIGLSYLKVRRLIGRKSDEEILNLPNSTKQKDVALKVMGLMGIRAFFAEDELMMGYLGLNGMQIVLKHGHSKHSSPLMASFAVVSGVLGDIPNTRRFGALALRLLGMYSDDEICAVRTLCMAGCFVTHLDKPMHKCLDDLMYAHDLGMRVGETHYALLSCANYVGMYVMIGLPLKPILGDMRGFRTNMATYGQEMLCTAMSVYIQYALNLVGDSRDPALLDGEAFNLEDHEGAIDGDVSIFVKKVLCDLRLYLDVYFSTSLEACRSANASCALHRSDGTAYYASWPRFNYGLAYLRMARESRRRVRYIRKAKIKSLRYFKHLVKHGVLNIQHKYLLLQAELLSVGRRVDIEEITRMYNKSIVLATKTGFIADAAIANERCGEFLVHIGDGGRAADYFAEAIRFYDQMDAKAKVDQMEEKHNHVGISTLFMAESSGRFRGQSRYRSKSVRQHGTKFPFPDFLRGSSKKNSSFRSVSSNDRSEDP